MTSRCSVAMSADVDDPVVVVAAAAWWSLGNLEEPR